MHGLEELFNHPKPIIGVVHLLPLIGSPKSSIGLAEIRSRALSDSASLINNGIDGIIIENYGDAPYLPDQVEVHTVASMTIIAHEIHEHFPETPIGINMLRNDARSAMAVATVTRSSFIRINVHTGGMLADQGILQGKAHDTLRYRRTLNSDVKIFADIAVKHAAPIADFDLRTSAEDTFYRGLADALIVTGLGTGKHTCYNHLRQVKDAVPQARVFAGSGVTADEIANLLQFADGAIVGTWLKRGGVTTNEVDENRVRVIVEARDEN
ncbi:MAG: BtpA/SgcQ family protein [Candidatus Poribacteria bacterium]|nr:BtpA/SgcQ family protein [Candidatus Poribacteria bacterium]MDE0503847.1 BtpA/SgcQ family protein [Candidatus Poribacteria bacterium]